MSKYQKKIAFMNDLRIILKYVRLCMCVYYITRTHTHTHKLYRTCNMKQPSIVHVLRFVYLIYLLNTVCSLHVKKVAKASKSNAGDVL